MIIYNALKKFSYFLCKWPGQKYFGLYRFLPLFFVSGAALEYCMIHWKPNGINFYEKFKHNRARELALKRYNKLKEIESLV